MDTPQQNEPANNKPAPKPTPKKAPAKLPSKPLVFGNQGGIKSGKKVKSGVSTTKKGGVNHMRKLSGM